MGIRETVVQLVLRTKNFISNDTDAASRSLAELERSADKAAKELEDLERVSSTAKNFSALNREAKETKAAFEQSAAALAKLTAEYKKGSAPSGEMTANLAKAKAETSTLRAEWIKSERALAKLTAEYKKADAPSAELTASLIQAGNANRTSRAAFEQSAAALAKLTAEYKQASKPSSDMVANLAKAKAETALLRGEWQRAEKALSSASGELRRSGVDVSKLASEQNRLEKEVRETSTAYQAIASRVKQARDAMKSAEGATATFGDRVRGLAASLGLLGGAVVIFESIRRGLAAMVGGFVTTGDQFERLRIQLAALQGGGEKAEVALEFIKDLTRNTPLQLEGVTNAFVQLRTFGLDPMDGSLQSLIDQNAKMAGSQEQLEGIIRAVGQAWTKQKLQAEEVNQLTERGIPVWDLLARATGKNVQELQKLASAGQLGRREIRALIDEIGRSSAGEAAAQMSTFSGLVSNLKDTWTDFLNRIANSGALDYLKEQLRAIGDRVSELAKSGELDKIAKSISDAFIGAVEALKSAVGFVVRFKDEIILLAKVLAGVKIVQFFLSMGTAAAAATRGAIGMAAAYGTTLVASLSTTIATIGRLGLALRVTLIGALIESIVYLTDSIQKFREYQSVMDGVAAAQQELARQQDQHAEKLQEISRETGVVVSTFAELEQKLKDGSIVIDEISGKYLSAAQSAALFAERNSEVAQESERISEKISAIGAAVEETTAQFQNLIASGKKVPAALDGIFDGIDKASPEKIRGITIALEELKREGKVTGDQVRDALSKALSDLPVEQVQQFKQLIEQTFKGLGERAQQAADIASGALDTLFGKLGVDADRFASGISRTGRELITTFTEIAKTAGVTSDQIRAAFNASIDKAKTVEDVNALIEAFRQYAQQAGISFQGIQAAELAAAEARLNLIQTTAEATGGELGFQAQLEQTKIRLLQGASAAISNADARRQVADAARDQADATEEAGEAAAGAGQKTNSYVDSLQAASDWFSAVLTGYGSQLANLSEEAAQAFQGFFGLEIQEQFDAANASMRDLEDGLSAAIRKSREAHEATQRASNAIEKWAAAWRTAAAVTEEAFFRQAVAAKRLEEQLDAGSSASINLIDQAERAIENFDLLGDEQLEPLRKAIEDAKDRLKDLGDELTDTISDLQDELDQLQGREDDVRRREYERRLAELEERLKQAKASGDRDLIRDAQNAIDLLKKVQAERDRQAAEEKSERDRDQKEREAKEKELTDRQPEPDPTPRVEAPREISPTPAPRTGEVVTIRFEDAKGAVDVTAQSRQILEEVLRILAEAGLNVSRG